MMGGKADKTDGYGRSFNVSSSAGVTLPQQKDVLVIGGGAVGLYAHVRLLQLGFDSMLIEKKEAPDRHSKSLGIHPVVLESFERVGLAEAFVSAGLKIRRGEAFWGREKLGVVRFDDRGGPFNFILALPQWRTEELLEDAAERLCPGSVVRGAELQCYEGYEGAGHDRTFDSMDNHPQGIDNHQQGIDNHQQGMDNHSQGVDVRIRLNADPPGNDCSMLKGARESTIRATWVIACDGKHGKTRSMLGIAQRGTPYPDTYLMGDFEDHTSFGKDAAVYLHKDGLIESFPLPHQQRRWVVKTDTYLEDADEVTLRKILMERLGEQPGSAEATMISSFGVQHTVASSFGRGRIFLAGDAAHVVSPIGGQGMNLGWLGVDFLMDGLMRTGRYHCLEKTSLERLLQTYNKTFRNMVLQTGKRAEMNMRLGRKESHRRWVKWLLQFSLRYKVSRNLMADLFTMRGLGRWFF